MVQRRGPCGIRPFAGGNPNVFEAANPIFRTFAKKFFHLGPSGAGTTMKLVVNAILGVEMQAIAEATAPGSTSGTRSKDSFGRASKQR